MSNIHKLWHVLVWDDSSMSYQYLGLNLPPHYKSKYHAFTRKEAVGAIDFLSCLDGYPIFILSPV